MTMSAATRRNYQLIKARKAVESANERVNSAMHCDDDVFIAACRSLRQAKLRLQELERGCT